MIPRLVDDAEGDRDLQRRAHIIEVRGQPIPVADLNDVIRSKEATGRAKDIVHLPILLQAARQLRVEARGKTSSGQTPNPNADSSTRTRHRISVRCEDHGP